MSMGLPATWHMAAKSRGEFQARPELVDFPRLVSLVAATMQMPGAVSNMPKEPIKMCFYNLSLER